VINFKLRLRASKLAILFNPKKRSMILIEFLDYLLQEGNSSFFALIFIGRIFLKVAKKYEFSLSIRRRS